MTVFCTREFSLVVGESAGCLITTGSTLPAAEVVACGAACYTVADNTLSQTGIEAGYDVWEVVASSLPEGRTVIFAAFTPGTAVLRFSLDESDIGTTVTATVRVSKSGEPETFCEKTFTLAAVAVGGGGGETTYYSALIAAGVCGGSNLAASYSCSGGSFSGTNPVNITGVAAGAFTSLISQADADAQASLQYFAQNDTNSEEDILTLCEALGGTLTVNCS